MVGENVGRARLFAREVLDHLRDDVAGVMDTDPVTDSKAEPLDLYALVQPDGGHEHAADPDGRQAADGRQLAGTADLDIDRFERRLGLLRGELVGKAPAWSSGDKAEAFLEV